MRIARFNRVQQRRGGSRCLAPKNPSLSWSNWNFIEPADMAGVQEDHTMKWLTVFVTAVVLAGLSATEAKAQTIAITSIDNKTVAGQLTINTQVTLPAGWTANTVEVVARPPSEQEKEVRKMQEIPVAGYGLAQLLSSNLEILMTYRPSCTCRITRETHNLQSSLPRSLV